MEDNSTWKKAIWKIKENNMYKCPNTVETIRQQTLEIKGKVKGKGKGVPVHAMEVHEGVEHNTIHS
jgi:hypothetical protein